MERWRAQGANVKIVLADRPPAGEDWWAQKGWGWIFKAWFRTWSDSREAMSAIRAEGWEPSFWGRKIRVGVGDGYDGRKLADFVLARWPNARVQIRND